MIKGTLELGVLAFDDSDAVMVTGRLSDDDLSTPLFSPQIVLLSLDRAWH